MDRRHWFHRIAYAGCPLGLAWLAGCGAKDQRPAPAAIANPPLIPEAKPVDEQTPQPNKTADILLFDIFGTVVEWRASLISQFQQFGDERKLTADWRALATQWEAAYLPSLQEVQQGRRTFVGLETLRRESLDRLLPSFQLDTLSEDDRVELIRCWARLQAWPDTVAGLTRLKRKYILVAFSNGGFGMLVNMARYSGLPWDAVLSADLFRQFKPNVEVYQSAADLLARPTNSLTLVASHNVDLASARAVGMKTAYLQRPTEDPKPTDNWNIIAQDFPDLANQLGA